MSANNRHPNLSTIKLRDQLKVKVDLTHAACVGVNPVIMDGENRRDVILAKRICSICPVSESCGIWAIWHEPSGIWGGMTPAERKNLRGGMVLVDLVELEQRIDLIENLQSSKTAQELAYEYDVSERTIYRWRA